MTTFDLYDQITLANGKTYIYIGTVNVDGHEYHFFTEKATKNKFILGKLEEDGRLTIIKDLSIIQKAHSEFVRLHPDIS